jgi:hypothetical protein
MPNCDVYATPEDHEHLLSWLFADATCHVYELASEFERPLKRFESAVDVMRQFERCNGVLLRRSAFQDATLPEPCSHCNCCTLSCVIPPPESDSADINTPALPRPKVTGSTRMKSSGLIQPHPSPAILILGAQRRTRIEVRSPALRTLPWKLAGEADVTVGFEL